MKQIQWFDDRFYKINDKFFPSVTTILGVVNKPFLGIWRGQVGNWEADRIINEALNKGSIIHAAIEILLHKGKVIFNSSKNPAYSEAELTELMSELKVPYIVLTEQQQHLEVYRFAKWVEEVKPQMVYSELKIASMQYEYAGTLDGIFDIKDGLYSVNGSKPIEIKEGRYLIDYKTGKEVDDNYFMQLSAYLKAYEEEDRDNEISGGIIIHTNAQTKGKIEGLKTVVRTREELELDFQDFLAVKKVFDRTNSIKPKIIELPSILELQ